MVLCWTDTHAEPLQAAAIEGLAQGPFRVVRVGFEPATLQTQGTKPTTEQPRPTLIINAISIFKIFAAVI